jgi:hypothetical protein
MSYGDEIAASDGYEPGEDEFDSADLDKEPASGDDPDWDDDEDSDD